MKFIRKNRCFIVAELSGNHDGKLSNLMKMIYKAKIAGADAVKIQAYEANGITMDSNKRYFKLGATSKWNKYLNYIRKDKHQKNGIEKFFHTQKELISHCLHLFLI